MTKAIKALAATAALLALGACTPEQRANVDSAAGSAEDVGRTVLSVLNLETGRHADADRKITDETETFAVKDTIFASVRLSGTVEPGQVTAQWIFPDSSVVDQKADSASSDNRLLFFLTKPEGLTRGDYRIKIIVNGRELRDETVKVQ